MKLFRRKVTVPSIPCRSLSTLLIKVLMREDFYKVKKLLKQKIIGYAMSDKDSATFANNVGGGSNECSIREHIDSLIREFLKERVADKKCRQQLFSWRAQDTKISFNNWSKEKTCESLQEKIKFLKQTISKYTQINQIQKEKIETLLMQRSQEEQKDWDNIQLVIAIYDKKFPLSQIEYSTENLTRDIRSYDQEYNSLCKKIDDMKDKLNNLMIEYNADSMKIDSNLRNLCSVVNGVRNKNASLVSAIRSSEDTLQELRNKLKQTGTVLCECKKIRENNFFRNIS